MSIQRRFIKHIMLLMVLICGSAYMTSSSGTLVSNKVVETVYTSYDSPQKRSNR